MLQNQYSTVATENPANIALILLHTMYKNCVAKQNSINNNRSCTVDTEGIRLLQRKNTKNENLH